MHEKSASEQIDTIIQKYAGWKGDVLSHIRATIHAADSDVIEETKWKMTSRPEGWPVWSHDGMVCFAEVWKDNVKLLFPKGAHIEGTEKLFNARLESKDIRALEFHEGDVVNAQLLTKLYLGAAELNAKKSL